MYPPKVHALFFLTTRQHSDWKKWTLYVSGDGKDDISDLIDHVTIKLHPTFSPSKVKLETAPFKFSRVTHLIFVAVLSKHLSNM